MPNFLSLDRSTELRSWMPRAGALTIMVLGTVAPLLPQEPNATELTRRALAAQGGESLRALNAVEIVGRVEVLTGFVGLFRSVGVRPQRLRVEWDIGLIRYVLGVDGPSGWEQHGFVRELPALDLSRARRRALLVPLVEYSRAATPVTLLGREVRDTVDCYAIEFRPSTGLAEKFYLDTRTYLVREEVRQTRYEDGTFPVTIRYGDYRKVGPVTLPFYIEELWRDVPLRITVEHYDLAPAIADSLFRYPVRGASEAPYQLSLSTIPRSQVYKEPDRLLRASGWTRWWGMPYPPTESWLVSVLVREKYGRQVEPERARLDFYSRGRLVKREILESSGLRRVQSFPVARFFPQEEIFHFRHNFSEPADPGIDKLVYSLTARAPNSHELRATLDIPLERYQPKTKLIFPIKGNFIVMIGHEFYELSHKYEWSQHFAYDIVGLGPTLDLARNQARRIDDWATFGREIFAPADGIVVYTRNDVPDMMPPAEYLKLPDPQWAIGGNQVIIDHGTGEYSSMFHMKMGSVQVRTGDRVRQGQVIGEMGSAGAPGYPHLHYQLQAGPTPLFGEDPLPSLFENVFTVMGGQQVFTPRRGEYMVAR